jgi:hypothetical protein
MEKYLSLVSGDPFQHIYYADWLAALPPPPINTNQEYCNIWQEQQQNKKIKSIYIVGSLENKNIPVVGNAIRQELKIEAFDNWWAASERADKCWQEYNDIKGLSYKQALNSYEAKNVFEFDKRHLDRTDAALLVMPAGKSGHLELGYTAGKGKPTFVLFDEVPSKFDVMHNFCTDVFFSIGEAIDSIRRYT